MKMPLPTGTNDPIPDERSPSSLHRLRHLRHLRITLLRFLATRPIERKNNRHAPLSACPPPAVQAKNAA